MRIPKPQCLQPLRAVKMQVYAIILHVSLDDQVGPAANDAVMNGNRIMLACLLVPAALHCRYCTSFGLNPERFIGFQEQVEQTLTSQLTCSEQAFSSISRLQPEIPSS